MSAQTILLDEGASPVGLVRAARARLGDFVAHEPESIWIELQHQDVDVPVGNRSKLMACVALLLVPSFYWDAIVFEKTALAFAGVPGNPEILEEATPAQLASAVAEAAAVIRDARNTSWEFESEPRAYAGVVLHRAGFVLAPAGLDFAQRALSRENGPEAEDLLGQVRKRWAGVSTDHLEQLSLGETAVDVQIARLAAVALRVRERAERARRDLADVA